MSIKKLFLMTLAISSLSAGAVSNSSALDCKEKFYYASKGSIKCSPEVHSFKDASFDVERVTGEHVNNWKINHVHIKSIAIQGNRGAKFTKALRTYLESNLTYSSFVEMLENGQLVLKVRNASFSCDIKTEVCSIKDDNFDQEGGLYRDAFYYGSGLEGDTSAISFFQPKKAAIAIDIAQFEKVLDESDLCDKFLTFSYRTEGNSMCVLKFKK